MTSYLYENLYLSAHAGDVELICPLHQEILEIYCHSRPDPLASCPKCNVYFYYGATVDLKIVRPLNPTNSLFDSVQ